MSKLKTHKGAAARFKLTGRGKLAYRKGGKRHLLTLKSGNRKRAMRKQTLVHETNVEKILRLLPGAGPAR